MSAYSENLHASAEKMLRENPDFQLAEWPELYFALGTEHLRHSLQVDLPAITEFLLDKGSSPAAIGRLAIYMYPSESALEATGRHHMEAVAIDNKIHYPVIGIATLPDRLNINKMNSVLRHELRHVLQQNTTRALYDRSLARHIARGVGLVAAAGFVKTGLAEPDMLRSGFDMLAAAGCSLTVLRPRALLHGISPREIGANFFARQHRYFKPISTQ